MTTIVVDAAIRDQLISARDGVEFRDPEGRLIGQFSLVQKKSSMFADIEFPSEEELDRRMRDGRRFTPEQVMERLRSLRGSKDAS
jgi:hypothetical protein